MYENRKRLFASYLLVILIVLALLVAALAYVRAAPAGCTSSVEPGVEPVTICQVLWLPLLATGEGDSNARAN